MSRGPTKRPPAPLLVLILSAALALPGCQSDGTLGRNDSYENIVWREQVRRDTYNRNLKATRNTLASIPGQIARSFAEWPRKLKVLQHLYFDGVGERWTYRERLSQEYQQDEWGRSPLLETPFRKR